MSYGIYARGVVEKAIDELIASLAIPIARTIYINPTFAINGDGTTWTQAATPGGVGAFNAWGTGSWASGAHDFTHFWRDGTRYLQAAETTYGATVVVYASVGLIFGAYDPATGAQIQDNTRHAKIHAVTGFGINFGTFASTRRLFLVDNLDVQALNRTASGNYPLSGTAAHDFRADVGVVRCILDGYTCSAMAGAGQTFIGNGFYGYGDGIGGAGTLLRAEYNTKLNDPDLPIYPAEYDMCALQTNSTYTVESYIIRNNDLRLPVGVTTNKQGAYFYNSSAVLSPNSPTGSMLIERNLIRGATQSVLAMFNDVAVLNNQIDGPITWGINMWGSRCRIEGNRGTGSATATAISLNASASAPGGTTTVRNNEFLGVCNGLTDHAATAARTLILENNIFQRVKQTTEADTAMRFIATTSTCTLQASNNTFFYDPADTAELFSIGSAVKTWAQYVAGWDANGLNTDPQLAANGGPASAASPSYHSGKQPPYAAYARNGIPRWIPPSRGASEYVEARPTRTLP